MNSPAIVEALGQLEAEARDLLNRTADLEVQLREVRAKLARTQAAADGLRRVLEPEPDNAAASPTPSAIDKPSSPTSPPEPEPEPKDEVQVDAPDGGGDDAQHKRFRSTQYVADLLATDARIWTFDEVVAAFKADGKTATMRNPPGAIRTALGRAAKKGLVVAIDDNHFRTVRPGGTSEGGDDG